MKLCASNIGWSADGDEAVYTLMRASGFEGLEIAPSRLFPQRPYEHLQEASEFARHLHSGFGLSVVSMQSLWYGMSQRIAGTRLEREELMACTVNALHFADALGCRNIVFGCPKNRRTEKPEEVSVVEEFMLWMAEEAAKFGAVIALEPNPAIYGTNFVNTTAEAIALAARINHPALKVNLDFGTMIADSEEVACLAEYIPLVNHVHISEPGLVPIKRRSGHKTLAGTLRETGYSNYVSIEMRKQEGIADLPAVIKYVREVFA